MSSLKEGVRREVASIREVMKVFLLLFGVEDGENSGVFWWFMDSSSIFVWIWSEELTS